MLQVSTPPERIMLVCHPTGTYEYLEGPFQVGAGKPFAKHAEGLMIYPIVVIMQEYISEP